MTIIYLNFGLNILFLASHFEILSLSKTHLGQPLNVSKCIYLFWNESNYSFRPRGILSMHTFNSFFGLNRFAKCHHFHKIIIFSKNRKFGSFIFDIQNGHLGQPYCFVSSVPWLSGESCRPTKAISKLTHSFLIDICHI